MPNHPNQPNQHLAMSITKVLKDGYRYLTLFVVKDGKQYAVDAHRGDFRDFLLENDKWYERMKTGVAERKKDIGDETFSHGGTDVDIEDIADDYSYGYLIDKELQEDYATVFELIVDDLVKLKIINP